MLFTPGSGKGNFPLFLSHVLPPLDLHAQPKRPRVPELDGLVLAGREEEVGGVVAEVQGADGAEVALELRVLSGVLGRSQQGVGV